MKQNAVYRGTSFKKFVMGITTAAMLVLPFTVSTATFAAAAPKVTICHATSSDVNPYNTLHVSANAEAGHFDNNGTPIAGHELDLLINDPDATCPTTGNVTVVKNVVGGSATSGSFNLHLKQVSGATSTDITNSPFPGNSSGTNFNAINAGFYYDVSEDIATDYTPSYSGDCDSSGRLILRGGYNLTCTVTNTFTGVTAPNAIDLAVNKSIDVSNPLAGNTVVYTVTVTNNGPDGATGVTVADTLPSGLTYVSSNTATGSYSNTTHDWTIGNLANGASAILTITATVNAADAAGTQITNTATATATETDSNPDNNSDSTSLTVRTPGTPSIDLAVTKSVDHSSVNASGTVNYTVNVTNNGPDAASNIVVTDLLPSNLTFGSSVVSQGIYNSITGSWSFASLANGATATITIIATVNSNTAGGTVITNTASADAIETDSNPANNSATATTTVVTEGTPLIDVAVIKSVSSPTITNGSSVTYTITVTNNGPASASNVVLADILPAGVTYDSSTTATGSYSNITHNWTIGTLASGSSASLTIVANLVSGTAVGTVIPNTASVSATETDSNPANNTSTANITVVSPGGNGGNGGGGNGGGNGGGSSSGSGGRVLGDTTSIPYIAPNQPGLAFSDVTTVPVGQVLGASTALPTTGNTFSWIWIVLSLIGMVMVPTAIALKMKAELVE